MLQKNCKTNRMKKHTMINIDLEYLEPNACVVTPTGETISEMGLAETPEDFSARAEAIW